MSYLMRLVAIVLASALVLAGCGGASTPEPRDTTSGSSGLVNPAQDLTTDELIRVFARAGIEVVQDAGDASPIQPVSSQLGLVYTYWQVDTMRQSLNAGRGYRAADLDRLVKAAGAEVPMAVILAGWLKAAKTKAADAARTLTGRQDWERQAMELVYSDAVVTLFVADLADSYGAARQGVQTAPAAYLLPSRAGLCTDLSNLLSSTLDSIVENLKINAEGGVGGVLATIWNTVIEIAASAAKIALGALTAPILSLIKKAASVLAVLSSASSLISPWTIKTTADPDPAHFGVEPASAPEVLVTARVESALEFEWPADIVDCAATAGVNLPNPGSVKDSPVDWNFFADPQIAQLQSKDDAVRADGTAQLRMTTGTESAKDHEKGAEQTGVVTVSASVKRTQIQDILDLVEGVLLDGLPGFAQEVLSSLLGPLKAEARNRLQDLLRSDGQAVNLAVTYHGPAPSQETPSPAATVEACPSNGNNAIPDGVYEGPVGLEVTGASQSGDIEMDSRGGGTMRIAVKDGALSGGKWSMKFQATGGGGDAQVQVRLNVGVQAGGGVKGSPKRPRVVGSFQMAGTAKVLKPIATTVPLEFSGPVDEFIELATTNCDEVTGTFVPSFNESTGGQASFTGVATWVGARVE